MTAGRCHTLLSPVTEESGEEGTSSEVSSSPVCRSPSPITHAEVTVTKVPTFSSPSQQLVLVLENVCFFLGLVLFPNERSQTEHLINAGHE